MSCRHTRRKINNFDIHTLANDSLSIAIAPALGGRVVSLCDRVSGREWLDGWQPADRRRLWQPENPADYRTSCGAGIDECLPTVLPCRIGRKELPDHGDLWNQQPEFDPCLATTGVLACRWQLRSLPLAFQRHISIGDHGPRFDYQLSNLSAKPVPFLWAWHPLFSWRRGDQIRFAPAVKTCLTPAGETLPWPETQAGHDLSLARFPKGSTPAAKVFAGPLTDGTAEIRTRHGACLTLTWPAALFPYAGIWITRGFWNGLHHWAIEPTNAPVDRLSETAGSADPALCMLDPRETRRWSLAVGLSRV